MDYERYHLKSERAKAVFRKNAIFMFLNTIAIPSLALNSIFAFIEVSVQTDVYVDDACCCCCAAIATCSPRSLSLRQCIAH